VLGDGTKTDIAQDFAAPSDQDHKKSLPLGGEFEGAIARSFCPIIKLPRLVGSFVPGGGVSGDGDCRSRPTSRSALISAPFHIQPLYDHRPDRSERSTDGGVIFCIRC